MAKYIINRCLSMIIILVATAFIIFTILYFTGDPARAMMGASATPQEVARLRSTLGLDRPYLVQLGDFMYTTFIRLSLGNSWTYKVPVLEELWRRLPRTVAIGYGAMLVNLIFGMLLGIFAGTHEGKWQDSTTMAIAMFFVSAPDFWVALMMIVLFSAKLGWLPAFGIGGIKYYIMPIIASALAGLAVNSRQTRSSILEVFRQDYITTARAKGQEEKVVIRKHMLPNALIPIVTVVGSGFARIIAGSPVIESIFSIPGVGLYMLTAINNDDFPALRGSVLFFALFTAVIMLVVDLVYAFIDPRIKIRYANSNKRKA